MSNETDLENQGGTGEENSGNPSEEEQNSNSANHDDNKEIVRQRDKNFEEKRKLEDKVKDLEDKVAMSEAERYRKSFLDDLAEEHKFTAKERKLLDRALDEKDAKELVDEIKGYREDAESEALAKLQEADQDVAFTPETASEKLNKLENSGDLTEALAIKLNTRR